MAVRKLVVALLGVTYLLLLGTACSSDSVGVNDNHTGDGGQNANATWEPPIDNLGLPGWQESEEPWAPENLQVSGSRSVWSDASGVYAQFSVAVPEEDGMYEAIVIVHNDGTGWENWLQIRDDFVIFGRIRGLSEGELLGFGSDHFGHASASGPIFPVTASGVGASANVSVTDVFVVHGSLAYAAAGNKVIVFDGDHWEPITDDTPHDVFRVWANERTVFAVGDVGTIVSLESGAWTIHDSNTVNTFTSIWGFSEDDIWLGDEGGGLHHYDGVEWTAVQWPNPQSADSFPEAIKGMWGQDGTLFFHTAHMLVRTDGVTFDVLGNWRCPPDQQGAACPWHLDIYDIWGNSATELFLATTEQLSIEGSGYWGAYLMWFDGDEFHWF